MEVFNCELCKAFDIVGYRLFDEHRMSSNHQEKLNLLGNRVQYRHNMYIPVLKPYDVFHCNLCGVSNMIGESTFNAHLKGNAHKKKLNDNDVEIFSCEICGVSKMIGKVVYQSHLDGKMHKKKTGSL